MRLLVLLIALLAVCPIARAQRMPAHTSAVSNPSPRAAPAAQPVTPDTAAALHRLFAGRRHRRNAITVGLGAGLALNIIDAGLTATADAAGHPPILNLGSAPGYLPAPSGGTAAATWLLAVLPGSALIALDYLAYAGFTRKREAQAIEAYQAGKLSQRLKKKLRPKHFRPAEAR